MSAMETVVTNSSVKYFLTTLLMSSHKSVMVGGWNNSVSRCPVRMNGSLVSLVWLGM